VGIPRFAVLTALSLLFASVAAAQAPSILGVTPPKPAAKAKAEPAESTEQRRERVSKLLAQARAESEGTPEVPPPGIDPREALDWRDAEMRLVAAYDIQLRALDEMDRAHAARKDAEARERDWHGFDSPPPYSVLMVDDLRDAEAATRDRIRVLEGELAQIKLDAQRAQDELRGADESARRAEETLASATLPEEKARGAWRRGLAHLRGRAAAAATVAAELHTRFRDEDLAARRAEASLLVRQIGVASAAEAFTEADLAKARQRIDDKLADVRRELVALNNQRSARTRERDLARQAMEQLRANKASRADQLAAAEARLATAETWIASDRDRVDALRGRQLIGESVSVLWGARYTASTGADAEARLAAVLRIREASQRARRYKDYVDSLEREARSRLSEVEGRLSADRAPAVVRYEQDALAARRAAFLAIERLREDTGGVTAHVERWLADLELVKAQRDLRARVIDAYITLRDTLRRLWDFELFAVEDTNIVDGQPVTIQRGVTVGKSVGAVGLFLLGYLAIAAIARRVEKSVVRRGFDAPRARTTRRWVLALSALLLAVLTLNLAHIPFTVFAFLGGALAIAAGFGTQTIIKNFISGMLVLMERQVQVGDIVEVDNITGTVTEVNLRSSTVRGFDGVETIVPNSALIENKVTNWTHSDRKVRRILKVGVAYGSPVRDVADILRDCAKRHGLVLDDPEPLVIFSDFGDNSLVFSLYIWVELAPNVNSLQVLSDLRFMIEKRFAEAGIVIAFPQRDVRLDAAKPLRVEVVPAAAPPTLAAAKQAAE
jgi:small-conductance mechanosensitive channel